MLLGEFRDVPNITLSTGKVDENDYKNYFGESRWKLIKGSLVLTRGKKVHTLYTMRAHVRGVEDRGVRWEKMWYKTMRDGRKALHENHEKKVICFKWVPKK